MTRARHHLSVALLLISMALPRYSASAQGLGSERADIRNFAGDIWSVWTSPAGMRPRDALTTAAALGAAVLTSRIDSIGYIWLNTHDKTFVMQLISPLREGALGSIYEFGSGQYLLPASGALYLTGRLAGNANLRDAGLGCAASHLASVGLRQVVFHSVKRGRPRVSASPFQISFPGSSEWSWESFYSGHISNSLACASFLGHRYSMGAAEPLPYIFALAIGVGRLADGHHWASDMLIGGVVGFAVGKAVAERQLKRLTSVTAAGAAQANRANWSIPVVQWTMVF